MVLNKGIKTRMTVSQLFATVHLYEKPTSLLIFACFVRTQILSLYIQTSTPFTKHGVRMDQNIIMSKLI